MANTYNRTYYEFNDGCLEKQGIPRQNFTDENVSIYCGIRKRL
jgi:hypothetical protein